MSRAGSSGAADRAGPSAVIDARAAQGDGWLAELVTTYARQLAPHVSAIVLDPDRATPAALLELADAAGHRLRACTIESLVMNPPELLHVLDVSGGRLPAALRSGPTWIVASVHDPRLLTMGIASADGTRVGTLDAWHRSSARASIGILRRADAVLAPTTAVAEAVTAFRPLSPWDVAILGTAPRVLHESAHDASTSSAGAIVCPDGLEAADGLAGVLAGYASLPSALRARHVLVVATGEPAAVIDHARHFDLAPGQLVLIARHAGPAAAGRAALVVAPGHARPVVADAVAARLAAVPVICPDGAAAARVVTHPGRRFAPNDAVAASAALADALTTIDAPHGPFAPTSWDEVVRRTLDSYDARRARPRPTIAFVSPLPPEATGVADYSRALVEALARRCHVTCFVPDDLRDERRPVGTTLEPTANLEGRASSGRFDEVVYALGNHPRHGIELAGLRATPGAVELHDARLVGAYAGLYPPGDALADELQRIYPHRFEPDVLRDTELSMAPTAEAGVWMAAEVAQLATVVLTHSAHAGELVQADSGIDSCDIGPLAVPALHARQPVLASDARPTDAPFIVSAGVVHESKRAELLIEAFAQLAGRHRATRLMFVGPVEPAYRRTLCALADRLGVGGQVVLTGRASTREYDRHLSHATVAVQLRSHSNGESSAAVADCLARGLPTVVTGDGASSELPGNAVRVVAPDVDAATLATVLGDLLDDPSQRSELAAGSRAYAAANTFDTVAERLLAALFGAGRC